MKIFKILMWLGIIIGFVTVIALFIFVITYFVIHNI